MAGEPLTADPGTTLRWLDSWPEGATYVFNREQIETVIASAKIEERAAARERIEALYVVRAKPPVAHDFCSLCKARNSKAGEPIDHWNECAVALAAPSDAPEKEPSDGCRTRGGQNRIDWCSVHDSEWPTGQARCNLVTAWQANDAPETP